MKHLQKLLLRNRREKWRRLLRSPMVIIFALTALLPSAVILSLYFLVGVEIRNIAAVCIITVLVGLNYFRAREDEYLVALFIGGQGCIAALVIWFFGHR